MSNQVKLTPAQLATLSPEVRAIVEAQQAALETTTRGEGFSLKVSPKTGAISIYGFGRFPVTMYAKNLLKVLDQAAMIRKFIEDNKANLSWEQTQEQKDARKAAYEAAKSKVA